METVATYRPLAARSSSEHERLHPGKLIVVCIATVFIVLFVLPVIQFVVQGKIDKLGLELVMLAAMVFFGYQLCRGKRWARWLTVCYLSGALVLIGAGACPSLPLALGLGSIYLLALMLLVFSPAVILFFRQQP